MFNIIKLNAIDNVAVAPMNIPLGAKINSVLSGKYSPDIEDVQHVSHWVLAHRLVKNYKAEADNITTNDIIIKICITIIVIVIAIIIIIAATYYY